MPQFKAAGGSGDAPSRSEYRDKDKPTQIRYSNITAAKGRPYLEHSSEF